MYEIFSCLSFWFVLLWSVDHSFLFPPLYMNSGLGVAVFLVLDASDEDNDWNFVVPLFLLEEDD